MATAERKSRLNDTFLFSPDPTHETANIASRSPLNPNLELRLNANSTPCHGKNPIFTFMQIQELEHQVLIFKYMVDGLPVPFHLVLPIWKSVAAANCVMGCGDLYLDYRSSLEPEPGRCRRTDGKKWRCARDVVMNQKYCERHMHRGRNRARKHVEGGGRRGGRNGVEKLIMPVVLLP